MYSVIFLKWGTFERPEGNFRGGPDYFVVELGIFWEARGTYMCERRYLKGAQD